MHINIPILAAIAYGPLKLANCLLKSRIGVIKGVIVRVKAISLLKPDGDRVVINPKDNSKPIVIIKIGGFRSETMLSTRRLKPCVQRLYFLFECRRELAHNVFEMFLQLLLPNLGNVALVESVGHVIFEVAFGIYNNEVVDGNRALILIVRHPVFERFDLPEFRG